MQSRKQINARRRASRAAAKAAERRWHEAKAEQQREAKAAMR
jgi:hypothetical protein